MKNSGSNHDLYAIVIGNDADEFVRFTIKLLADYDIGFALCEDVYQAVGWLTKNTRGNGLVIGRLRELNAEKGRFLQKTNEYGCSCCCLEDTGSAQKYLQNLAAIGTDAFIINEPAEIEEVFVRLLEGSLIMPVKKKEEKKASAFNRDEFLTTRAEIDALLGAGTPASNELENGSSCK